MNHFYRPACVAFIFVFIVFILAGVAQADSYTTGPNGINSAGLLDFDGTPLTGAGVVIGQVEPGRPGRTTSGSESWSKSREASCVKL
jgi:hypothetical protein